VVHVIEKMAFIKTCESLPELEADVFSRRKLLMLNGGQRRDRTADAGLFRATLCYAAVITTRIQPKPKLSLRRLPVVHSCDKVYRN